MLVLPCGPQGLRGSPETPALAAPRRVAQLGQGDCAACSLARAWAGLGPRPAVGQAQGLASAEGTWAGLVAGGGRLPGIGRQHLSLPTPPLAPPGAAWLEVRGTGAVTAAVGPQAGRSLFL